MKPKIFIDGREGTTGLQIYERLSSRRDIELLQINNSKRKDVPTRKMLINKADIAFLCLPDDAACEAITLIDNDDTRVLDASTAHRVADSWVYGLPELSAHQRERIHTARYVSNPGCHSTGAILLIAPLVESKLLPADYPLVIISVTGYTGGGKKMIAEYETSNRVERWDLDSPRLYSTGANHKHIPEIVSYSGLANIPVFTPIVADYPQGLQIIIPVHMPGRRREAFEILKDHYSGCINIDVLDESPTFTASNFNSGTDNVTLRVLGFDDKIILTAQMNNLGKGAAGAMIQNMNIMLGFDEYDGLIFK